ncbi:MAG TPA: glucokinase [Candidatus Eisenbacteria bacterium]|nr:glucokinase [Candidatus Eisenbacteria bacterium]
MNDGLVLAADVGGTKTRLALVPALGRGRIGDPSAETSVASADFPSLEALLEDFRASHRARITAVSVGYAGPVTEGRAAGTHVPWTADESSLERRFGAPAYVINDLVASGYGVPALGAGDLETLLRGSPGEPGNAAIVSAGTGLGESTLLRHAGDWIPVASEGGHADYAPRTDLEIEVFRALRDEFGRVSVERVLSGLGLGNIARVLHRREGAESALAKHLDEAGPEELPAAISANGLAGACPSCVRSLELFVSAYGAEAGNAALRGMAVSGVYLGGGIAPKILAALRWPLFRDAFLAKEPHRELLERVPVFVVLTDRSALLGAARYATL